LQRLEVLAQGRPELATVAPGVLDELPEVAVEIARTLAYILADVLAQRDKRLLRVIE
jgi:hypothetical protein